MSKDKTHDHEHKSKHHHNNNTETKTPRKKSPMVFVGLILFFGAVVLIYWLVWGGVESTNDAKVSGHIVNVAPRIEGQIEKIYVENGSVVKKGDPLVLLDNSFQQANLELAHADFDAAVASFKQATVDVKQARATFLSAQSEKELELKNLNRVLSLKKQKAITQQAVDQQQNKYDQAVANFEGAQAVLYMSENVYKVFGNKMLLQDTEKFMNYSAKMKDLNPTLDSALAKLKRAKANLDIATLNLSYTTVRAPYAGTVANKTAEVGQNANPSVPLLSLVSLNDTWITANFKETQLNSIALGDLVKIKIDTFGGKVFTGVVSSLSSASGDSFALLPPDNASGNFIKVTQRFPVRIDFKPIPTEITRPGMSAEVSVKVK